MNCSRHGLILVTGAISCLILFSTSNADEYTSGFEALNSSTGGTSLTGQDGYYIPAGTASVDFNVYDYQNNTLGIAQNPNGQNKFIAGEGPAGGTFARGQRNLNFSTGIIDIVYDMAAFFTGVAPSSNNIGSFSTRTGVDGANTGYIHLFTWVDAVAATNFQTVYNAYNSDGSALNGLSPGAAFTNLDLNHWYQFETRLDYNTNQITRATIIDLNTGTRNSVDLTDVYLPGGATGPIEATGFRFFGGGGTAGNVTAWDNITIAAPVPEPASLALLVLGGFGLIIGRKRRRG